jgi:hypothetical protein
MSDALRLPGFVYLASFERAAKGLLSEVARNEIERILTENPEAGDVIAGTGGVRKIRFAQQGRGKRGGIRVIYYHWSTIGRVYLITVYAKNVQVNVTAAQRNMMKQLTTKLDSVP